MILSDNGLKLIRGSEVIGVGNTFPNGDPRMQIRLADTYESSTTYTGRIWIYRVTTDRAYAASLERGACVPPRK